MAKYGYRYYEPETGKWVSRDPIGERASRNIYSMAGNAPVLRIDLLGLYDIAVIIFDGQDPGGPGVSPGKDHAKFAKESGAEIIVNSQDLSRAVAAVRSQLQQLKQSYERKVNEAERNGIDPTNLGTLGLGPPEIAKLTVLDHAQPGSQSFGGPGSHIDPFKQPFQDLASLVIERGTIVFRGCQCASGPEGRRYIEDAAVMAHRKVIGYTVNTISSSTWNPPPNATFRVDPSKVTPETAGPESMWPKFMFSLEQVLKQDRHYCPIKDSNTGKLPAHIEQRLPK